MHLPTGVSASVLIRWCCVLVASLAAHRGANADAPMKPEQDTQRLTIDGAVAYSLENNPELAALRQQHGIAAATVVIAKTYPFNPVYQGTFAYAKPAATTAANPVPNTHQVTLELQLFHQQRFRQEAAFAALNRTDWEIAAQELSFAVRAIRAFDNVVYRQRKLAVTQEFLRLNQASAEHVLQLVEEGTLKAGDLLIARAEVRALEAQVGLSRTALVTAERDLHRVLGIAHGQVRAVGTLERVVPEGDIGLWLAAAMEMRPDRFARWAAISEAQSNVSLQRADRFGNPRIGPVYEFDEARTNFLGVQVQVPLPLFNRRRGEIQTAEAEQTQAYLRLQQTEVQIQQDVNLATRRLTEAQDWAENYRGVVLPALRQSLKDMEALFEQGQPGVDVLRILDVRRKLLQAEDGYLDALLAYTSALADLAEAVGNPGLALQPPALAPVAEEPRHSSRSEPSSATLVRALRSFSKRSLPESHRVGAINP